jgi:zinc protease
LRRSLFAAHPHERFPLGTTTTVPRVELSDLRAHHGRYYGRKTTIFAFAGDISEEHAARITDSLSEVLPPENEAAPAPQEPTPRTSRHFTLVDKGGRHQTQLALGLLGTKPHDEDHTALCVANTAFGGTFTSRLMQEIRGKRGWSYGASSHLHASTVREAFSCSAAPAAGDAAACLALMVKLIEVWRNDGLSSDELEFCKAYLRRSYAFEVDTPKKRVQRKLHNMLLGFAPDHDAHYIERLGAVTLASANDAVRRRIDPTALCIAAVASEEEQGGALREALVGLDTSDVLAADFE